MELPAITNSTYGSNSRAFNPNAVGAIAGGHPGAAAQFLGQQFIEPAHFFIDKNRQDGAPVVPVELKGKASPVAARIVRVFIADPDINLPLDRRVIYKSSELLTDATDQELFFEANPAAMLKNHNEYRTTVLNKAMTEKAGKEIKLEPARIRDLRMVVVDIASF